MIYMSFINIQQLRRRLARSAPGPEVFRFTDQTGDALSVAANGRGEILFGVNNQFCAIPATELIPLFTQAVRATGLSPEQLAAVARAEGLVVTRPQTRSPLATFKSKTKTQGR